MSIKRTNHATAAALSFLTVAGIFAGLAVAVKLTLNVPAIGDDRAVERSQALAEIRVTEEKSLATAATLDAPRGIVRLPIEDAMKLAVQKWRNPSAARADLNTRAEKAAAELPKAPEKPSAFE